MITAIVGSMKAGKTKLLNELIEIDLIKKHSVRVFYPKCCYKEEGYVVSRYGTKVKAIPVTNVNEIYSHIHPYMDVFIDEIQFLEYDSTDVDSFVEFIKYCNKNNINLTCSGLNLDFKEDTFSIVEKLLSYSTKVINKAGVCEKCYQKDGERTIRFIDDIPSSSDEEVLLLENVNRNVEYKTYCVDCYNDVYKDGWF